MGEPLWAPGWPNGTSSLSCATAGEIAATLRETARTPLARMLMLMIAAPAVRLEGSSIHAAAWPLRRGKLEGDYDSRIHTGDERTPTRTSQRRGRAFPSWFMGITCDRCGKERMISEAHMPQGDMLIRDILERRRHDGCGGRAGKVELVTGIEGVSSRPVRRIALAADGSR
jgi:hypothetical protein